MYKILRTSAMFLTSDFSSLVLSNTSKQNNNNANLHKPSSLLLFLKKPSSLLLFLKLNVLLTLINISIILQQVHTIHGAYCNQMDRDSLSLFNLSIISSASHPLNWSLSFDCCSWEGIGCDESGRVTNLSLPSRGLVGSIPPSIANLSRLQILSLPDNKLKGFLPSSLANCTELTTLNLRGNSLEGELSAFDFSKFVHLKIVDLGFNNFHGGLPPTLFSCKTVRAIRLTSNQLTGQILPETSELQSLSFLSFSNNCLTNLTNAISILSQCKNLTTLLLSSNFHGESLPGANNVNLIKNGFQNVRIFSLDMSRLTGQIPVWLSQLKKLEALELSHNRITGSIPNWVGDLQNLFLLDFSCNLLSGNFPMALLTLPRLAFDEVESNVSSFLELPVFFLPNNSSNLQYNLISNLPRMINLGNNLIGGSIPAEIGKWKLITLLNISHNNFTGEIPDTISNLTNLERLDLSGNHLSGEIPASLKNLHFLSDFSVAYNDLQGPIPTGGQFDTFPRSSFEGNPGLCGGIWLRSCSSLKRGEGHREETRDSGEDIFNWIGFAIGFGVCFFVAAIARLRETRDAMLLQLVE